jgi:hypothetical protein
MFGNGFDDILIEQMSCGAAPTAGAGEPMTCAGRPSGLITRVRRSQRPGADMEG